MFVYSLKASKLKVFGLTLLCAIVLGIALTFIMHGRDNNYDLPTVAAQGKDVRFDGIKTDEDLHNFIASLGIQVKTPAYNKTDVDLPRVFDAVYVKYNDIQKQQGFDLSKYCGKTLTRYTFEMTNYPLPEDSAQGKVYLTLFVYKNKVVGGDISSRDNGGFVSTFVDFNPGNV
ncbi:MAG: DUF4830 domain-containing protein [Clostridia bacterium]|nr:DUF4830 domain-containing protein [Clostridia bacterium]